MLCIKESLEIQRTERAEKQKHSQHEAEVADAVDDECFLACVGRRFFHEIEADEEIAREADTFPANKQQHIIRCQHQNQHEEHEQIEVGEKAVIAAFMRHVAGGVNVDEPSDAGDHQHHDHGELVHLQIEAGAEISCGDPSKEFLSEENLPGVEEFADRFQGAEK